MINKFTQSPLGLPKLRFKGFDGKWEEKTIKDVLDYEIYGNNISYDTKLFLDAPAIMKKNYSKFDNQNSFFAPSDTIIFIKDGSNAGNFFYSINNSRIASTCAYIKTLCYNLFIYYLLENNKQYIQNNLIVGETIPHLYKNTLINILIHFPSLQEQTKIATFFSLLDKQIELWEKKLQLVELIFKKIGQDISKKFFKQKKIKLSYYLSASIREPINDLENKTPISISLYGKGLKKSNLLVKLSKNGRDYFIRNNGDLIIGSQNFHNGSVAILEEYFENPIMSSAIFSFDVKNIKPKFLRFLLLLSKFQFYLKNNCVGTGQKEFSIRSIMNLDFYLIGNDFEYFYYKKICLMDEYIKSITKKILYLEKDKFFYLKNLFL